MSLKNTHFLPCSDTNDVIDLLPQNYIDGRMTCDFTSFSIVFQSYQDNERLIMKGCVQWSSVVKISPRAGIELGPLDQ